MLSIENSVISELSDAFYSRQNPDYISSPQLLKFNQKLAKFLNLSIADLSDNDDELAEIFAGNQLSDNTQPISLAYAGHQFGHFVAQLGDGRAILLGDVVAEDKLKYDIQLKGSGQTEFSRNGDGKSALGPVLREYIVSEAMFNLGIPSTRALAALATNESVYRQKGPEPGGIFTRVARAHIRIGTFEFYAARQKHDELTQLADFTIARLYPEIAESNNPYLELFKLVANNLLKLVAKWQAVGFIHGVMNTDNMSLAGETIDYGPCAFMDTYQANKVFSSIDKQGRYAYNQQQNIVQWNLSILASCLVPLIDKDEKHAISKLNEVMESLSAKYEYYWLAEFRPKLGLFNQLDGDKKLIKGLLKQFELHGVDFTNGFRDLVRDTPEELIKRWEEQPEDINESIVLMNQHNPFVIPRNHQIERAIKYAYQDDFEHFHRLIEVLENPFVKSESSRDFTIPPTAEERVRRTFCGT